MRLVGGDFVQNRRLLASHHHPPPLPLLSRNLGAGADKVQKHWEGILCEIVAGQEPALFRFGITLP